MEVNQEATNLREKYRAELMKHVNKHYSISWYTDKFDNNLWEIKCWLGKEPTGQLFKLEMTEADNLNDSLKRLANDMWDFLFTEKGEQIIKAEYEKEHGEPWKTKIWKIH